jgi:hypothetical protein
MARHHGVAPNQLSTRRRRLVAQRALTAAAGWRPPRSMRSRATGFGLSSETIDFRRTWLIVACFGHAESALGGRLLRGREQVIVNAEMKQRAE